MLSRSSFLFLANNVARKGVSLSSTPPPVVVRSLYRSLLREVSWLDRTTLAKVLFLCSPELKDWIGELPMMYVPNSKSYAKALREAFQNSGKSANLNLAFSTLNRLRVHRENLKSKLPFILRDQKIVLEALKREAPKQAKLFRAEPLINMAKFRSAPYYVPSTAHIPGRVVSRVEPELELKEGTALVAHLLSSTGLDRRVMMITERTPFITTGVVLDLQYGFPVSKGNPLFPEVFWGHDVYDGGYNQVSFTMPPTAQVLLLHTLEPPQESLGEATQLRGSWLSSWRSSAIEGKQLTAQRQHEIYCQPLIRGRVLENGEREPTLYFSRASALPYLAGIAAGQPRKAVRIYWGNIHWPTRELDAEVSKGHWIPVKVSPSFFCSYELSGDDARPCHLFPTVAELREVACQREKRYSADMIPPEVFSIKETVRRRDFLWDEIMYALGGEYAALAGTLNPSVMHNAAFSLPRIVSPLPLSNAWRSSADHETLQLTLDDDSHEFDADTFTPDEEGKPSLRTTGEPDIAKAPLGEDKKPNGRSSTSFDHKKGED